MSRPLDDVTIALGAGSQIGLSAILAVMMFAVALSLRLSDFAFLRDRPLQPLIGVAAQVIALPALTLALLPVLAPSPSIALGMVVVACCPGGNVSNLLTLLARGDAALSVSLTAVSSALAAILTPAAILFWSGLYPPTRDLVHQLDVDGAGFIVQTTLILAVPLAAGLALSATAPRLAGRLRAPLVGLAVLGLGAIIIFGVAANWRLAIDYGRVVFPIVAAHNAAAFAAGFAIAALARFPAAQRRTLTFEVGIQNAGLGLVILLSQFQGLGGAAAVTAAWGVWHLIAGSALAGAWRLFGARDAAGERAR